MNDQTLSDWTIYQDPKQSTFVQNPYSLYRELHISGHPVFWENYGFWCLPDFESVNRALRDKRFARLPPVGFENPPMPDHLNDFAAAEKYSLLALEPPEHSHIRKAVNHAFISRNVGKMSESIEALANSLIDRIEQKKTAELLSSYARPIPVAIITRLLGVPESDGEQLVAWSHAMVRVYTLLQSTADEHAANLAARDFQRYLQTIMNSKRQSPGDDLISILLADQTLNEAQIISIAILLLNAGHEATVHQLGNAIKTLLKQYPLNNRDALLSLLRDDRSADALVGECMRFDAPLHLFTRFAQTPVTLDNGITLKAGEQVGLLLASANRCPHKFQQANTFLPLRNDAAHLSLGAGIHYCVGAHLARLELRIGLQVLFDRLPKLSLAAEPQYQDTYHFHGLEELQVNW